MSEVFKQSSWEGEGLHNQCLAPSPKHIVAFVKPHNPLVFFHQCIFYIVRK